MKLSVQYFHLYCIALQPDSFRTPSRLSHQLLASSRVTIMSPEVVRGGPKILLLNPVSCLFAFIQMDDWKIQGKHENKWIGFIPKTKVTFKKPDKRINFIRAFFTQKQTWFTTQKKKNDLSSKIHFSYFQVGNLCVDNSGMFGLLVPLTGQPHLPRWIKLCIHLVSTQDEEGRQLAASGHLLENISSRARYLAGHRVTWQSPWASYCITSV